MEERRKMREMKERKEENKKGIRIGGERRTEWKLWQLEERKTG